MPRFYVSMTWDDWPEGGSYGTVVEAADHDEAEALCRREMAQSRIADGEPGEENSTPEYWLEHYGDKWHVVDCYDLDKLILEDMREHPLFKEMLGALKSLRALASPHFSDFTQLRALAQADAVIARAETEGAGPMTERDKVGPVAHPRVRKICETCGSTEVVRDAWAEWDEDDQQWVLQNVFDDAYCETCEGSATIIDEPIEEA